jgi:hypothetical protein
MSRYLLQILTQIEWKPPLSSCRLSDVTVLMQGEPVVCCEHVTSFLTRSCVVLRRKAFRWTSIVMIFSSQSTRVAASALHWLQHLSVSRCSKHEKMVLMRDAVPESLRFQHEYECRQRTRAPRNQWKALLEMCNLQEPQHLRLQEHNVVTAECTSGGRNWDRQTGRGVRGVAPFSAVGV